MRMVYLLSVIAFALFSCNGNGGAEATTSTVAPSLNSGEASVAVSTVASGTDPVGPAKIELDVEGMMEGPALLIGYFENQQFRADSTYLKNGKATFIKADGYSQGFYFVYLPNKTSLQLLLGEDQEFKVKTSADDLVYSTEVDGSIDNELLYENQRFQSDLAPRFQSVAQAMQQVQAGSPEYNELKTQQDQLVKERTDHLNGLYAKAPNSFFTSFKSAGQNPDLKDIRNADGSLNEAAQLRAYRNDFWNNVNFADKRLLRTPVVLNKLKRFITELTPQNPDSILASTDALIAKVEGKHPDYFKFIVNWVALNYQPTKTTLMDSEAVMVHMVQNYFTKEKAFWAQDAEIQGLQQRASEMAASLVNRKGPDVISTDPQGVTRSIYEMKEPYIVVYMYNPECEHCQEETPLLKAYADRNPGKIGVFAIAIDTDATKWNNYIQKVGMQNFVNVFDPSNRSIYAKYFVDKTPEMYVLNRDRIIIGKNLKTFQVEELVNREEAKR